MRAALQRHRHGIVRITKAAGDAVLCARQYIAAILEHDVNRIVASAAPGLRPVLIEVQPTGDDLAATGKSGRRQDSLRRDEVERAKFVVGAPPSPVGITSSPLANRIGGDLRAHAFA